MDEILKVVVGSHAHGLATEDSDVDYRGVHVAPTAELFRLRAPATQLRGALKTVWGKDDDADSVSWEVGRFLHLATHSNPTILEVFCGPVIDATAEGREILGLFPYVWSSQGVRDAFSGYSKNQRKKFLDAKDGRPWKFAVAYIRVLALGAELLRTGKMTVMVDPALRETLREIREGRLSRGDVLNCAESWQACLDAAFEENPDMKTNFDAVNDVLLPIRRRHWADDANDES